MAQTKYKRRQFFIKDGPQAKLILKTYLLLFFVMFTSGIIFYIIGNNNLSREFYQAHSTIKSTMDLLLPALIIVNIIAFLGAAFLVVGFTHSISGPIYRLKCLSERIAKGDLTVDVKFRKNDALQELSAIINTIIKSIGSNVKQVEGELSELNGLLTKIENIETFSQSEFLVLKKDIQSITGKMKEKVGNIKL